MGFGHRPGLDLPQGDGHRGAFDGDAGFLVEVVRPESDDDRSERFLARPDRVLQQPVVGFGAHPGFGRLGGDDRTVRIDNRHRPVQQRLEGKHDVSGAAAGQNHGREPLVDLGHPPEAGCLMVQDHMKDGVGDVIERRFLGQRDERKRQSVGDFQSSAWDLVDPARRLHG